MAGPLSADGSFLLTVGVDEALRGEAVRDVSGEVARYRHEIAWMPADASMPRQRLGQAAPADPAVFSPDGRSIVFDVDAPDQGGLWIGTFQVEPAYAPATAGE